MEKNTGENIKNLREDRGLDQRQLADRLKTDLSFIKKIETNEIEPLISDLFKIANALGTDISTLLYKKAFTDKKATITKGESRVRIERGKSYDYESLAPYYSGRHMEPLIVEIFEQKDQKLELSNHRGEEFHYVLEGTLLITIEDEEYTLTPGDSIYFDSALPHSLNAKEGPVKVIAVVYNRESMLHFTKSKKMRDLIQAAKHLGGKNIVVVCPDKTAVECVEKGIEEGVIKTAFLIGDKNNMPLDIIRVETQYEFIEFDSQEKDYYKKASEKGVEIIRKGQGQMLMKGKMNTADFVKAVLNKEKGIATERRLSLVSLFELPEIDRLIFLTDPGINPALVSGQDLKTSIDIINNAIDVAKSFGIVIPKVALLEANEVPTEKLPSTLFEKQLAEMDWLDAKVDGPLSYDLALYEDSVKKKGLENNEVAGKADILVVPYLSAGNFLYKVWAMTMHAEAANIVLGAQAPLIITSRNDSEMTKFLTICACAVYSQYITSNYSHVQDKGV